MNIRRFELEVELTNDCSNFYIFNNKIPRAGRVGYVVHSSGDNARSVLCVLVRTCT